MFVNELNMFHSRTKSKRLAERENFPRGQASFPPDGVHDSAAASPKTVQLLSNRPPQHLFANTGTRVYTRAPAKTREHFTPTTTLEFDHHQVPSALSPVHALFRDTWTFLLALEHLESSPLV